MSTLKSSVYRVASKLLPKLNRVVIIGSNTIEGNAVELANYISEKTDKKVYFLVREKYKPFLEELVPDNVRLVHLESYFVHILLLTSKYVFKTHGNSLPTSSSRQVEINVWHGILYKNIRLLRGESGLYADVTVGTSELSQKMFSQAFGVSIDSVYISGYPRNDMLLRTNENPNRIKEKIGSDVFGYDKVVFWMPTFRRNEDVEVNERMNIDNPFQVDGFDVKAFNDMLKRQNTLCLLKPHYFYLSADFKFQHSNIVMIHDEWIAKKGVALYELLACTDILISDFSSVMYDYSLLNKPIVCFSTDVEDYKRTQGLYFDDIENWLPSKLIQNQEEFFAHLKLLLQAKEDPYVAKRLHVKNVGFTYNDANSTKRLCTYVFSKYD